MSARRVRTLARGRVQGVSFRAFTATAAREAGLSGWVRNRSDGSVEAVLEGDSEAVERVLAQLERGPAYARVDGLQTREEPPAGEVGFVIRP